MTKLEMSEKEEEIYEGLVEFIEDIGEIWYDDGESIQGFDHAICNFCEGLLVADAIESYDSVCLENSVVLEVAFRGGVVIFTLFPPLVIIIQEIPDA